MPYDPGPDPGDRVHDLHSLRDPAEDRVAPALGILSPVVQEIIVLCVDEKLAGRAVGLGCSCHGYGAPLVSEPVIGLVDNRPVGGFLLHPGGKPPSLDHEIRDYAVKDSAVIEPGFHVDEEVFDRDGSVVGVELQDDLSHGCVQGDPGIRVLFFIRARGGGYGKSDQSKQYGKPHVVSFLPTSLCYSALVLHTRSACKGQQLPQNHHGDRDPGNEGTSGRENDSLCGEILLFYDISNRSLSWMDAIQWHE